MIKIDRNDDAIKLICWRDSNEILPELMQPILVKDNRGNISLEVYDGSNFDVVICDYHKRFWLALD